MLARIARVLLIGVLVSTGLGSSGCSYAKNRLRDFVDPVAFGGGFGLGANLRATQYVQFGWALNPKTFRVLGRHVHAPVGPSGEFGFAPFFFYRATNTSTLDQQTRLTLLARTLVNANEETAWNEWYDSNKWRFLPDIVAFREGFDRRFFDVGLSFYFGLGFDVDLSVIEFVDFIAGIFGLDPCGDDVAESEQAVTEATEEAES